MGEGARWKRGSCFSAACAFLRFLVVGYSTKVVCQSVVALEEAVTELADAALHMGELMCSFAARVCV